MSRRKFRNHRPLYSSRIPRAAKKPRMRWKILPIMWLALKRTAMALGFLMLFNLLLLLIILPSVFSGDATRPSLPKEFVLFVEFKDGFAEISQSGGFGDPFAAEQMSLRRAVEAIEKAGKDDRVKGILARLRGGSFELAHVQEVRAAVKNFRESGKFAHIYSSSLGEGGGGLSRYYLASAFDEIWMQPLGVVSIPGVNIEMPFMRGSLDKLGVRPQFYKRKDFKTAYENITDRDMSAENRQMTQQLVEDIKAEFMTTIPAERGLTPEAFERLVDQGLFTAQSALENGLITHADYGDELVENVAFDLSGERDAEKLDMVPLETYAECVLPKDSGDKKMLSHKPKVALIYAVGAIMPEEEAGGLGGSQVAAASVLAPAILAVSRDKSIDTIVLRIDSPGGSPTASESILRAVHKAKQRGKKVIVSMGPVAASGGYWIAAYADRIFALPTTLTGSIGVVGGKFSVAELSNKLGVNWDSVSWGENADLWSVTDTFSPSGAKQINAMLDNVYSAFVERVALGRGMSVEAVDSVAGGRVWTGKSAVEVGLADEIGGLSAALDFAAREMGLESREDVQVVIVPKPKTALEQLMELLEGQVIASHSVKAHSEMLKSMSESFAPAIRTLQIRKESPLSTYEPLRLD